LRAGKPESTRFPNGYYNIGIAIDGDFTAPSLSVLRQTIETAVRNHSGWPPFLTINRTPFSPKPIDGAVEFWRGPESTGECGIPSHHDFWRVSPQGLFFTRMGYREDGGQESGFPGLEPGKYFHITTSTWRLGETILEATYIARAIGCVDANLIIHSAWHGITGRRLTSRGSNRLLVDDYVAEQDTYDATQTVALNAVLEALPEVVHAFLAPLYELFGFFQLPKRLVEEELASLQRNQFS
jgi:hypothetical protein